MFNPIGQYSAGHDNDHYHEEEDGMEMLYPHRHHHQSIPGKHQHQHQGIPGKRQHQHQGIPGMLAAAWVPDQCQTQAKPSEKLRFRQKKLDIILNRQHVEYHSEIAGTWPDHVKY